MVTLLITRGYPGSGKTTLARKYVDENPRWVRVNRDDLRNNMFGKYFNLGHDCEDAVTVAQRAMVIELLHEGWNVVVDDTNLNPRSSSMWKAVARAQLADFHVVDVTTDVTECMRRDRQRRAEGKRDVGWEIVEWFAHRYPMPWPEVR